MDRLGDRVFHHVLDSHQGRDFLRARGLDQDRVQRPGRPDHLVVFVQQSVLFQKKTLMPERKANVVLKARRAVDMTAEPYFAVE